MLRSGSYPWHFPVHLKADPRVQAGRPFLLAGHVIKPRLVQTPHLQSICHCLRMSSNSCM